MNWALSSPIYIHFISYFGWFLRLLCLWHWIDDQSDINQASWYKLIVKLNVTLWQHRPRSTVTLTQGLSVPYYFLIECTWYILGTNLVYAKYILVYTQDILCVYWVHVLYILAMKYVHTWNIPYGIHHVYSWYITLISPPSLNMHCICMVYTWYIPFICSTHTYG